MCATYSVKSRLVPDYRGHRLSRNATTTELFTIDRIIAPFGTAPVLIQTQQGELREVAMQYSLVPYWSATQRPKFATYNARIETVSEKPSWRKPFLRQPVVVPVKAFFESTLGGPWPHHLITIAETQDDWLFAAGIWDAWKGKSAEDVPPLFSFAILTTEPCPQIAEFGHDRSPIFLSALGIKAWLESQHLTNPRDKTEGLLKEWSTTPTFKASPVRKLKSQA